jgi:hypothetical protein
VHKRCGLDDDFGLEPEADVLDGAIDEAMREVRPFVTREVGNNGCGESSLGNMVSIPLDTMDTR